LIDTERCRTRGIEIVQRRAGGGVVLLDQTVLCAAMCVPLPDARVADDLTESYRWVGAAFSTALRELGFADARRAEVAEARADVAHLKASGDPLLHACFGALSPHEVIIEGARKVVGLAQVRRRHAALYQVGVLLRDQSPLADLLRLSDEPQREAVRDGLCRRTAGLGERLDVHALAARVTSKLLEPDEPPQRTR
jgi:lipoate-protein ligase A